MEFIIKCPDCEGNGGGFNSQEPTDNSTWCCKECDGTGKRWVYLEQDQLKQLIQHIADEEYTEARNIINL